MNSRILHDPRPIKWISVYPHGEDGEYYAMPTYTIHVYGEPTAYLEGPRIPWFEVWKDGELLVRIIASACQIAYEAEEKRG